VTTHCGPLSCPDLLDESRQYLEQVTSLCGPWSFLDLLDESRQILGRWRHPQDPDFDLTYWIRAENVRNRWRLDLLDESGQYLEQVTSPCGPWSTYLIKQNGVLGRWLHTVDHYLVLTYLMKADGILSRWRHPVDPDLDRTLGHHVNTTGQQLLSDQPLYGVGRFVAFLKSVSQDFKGLRSRWVNGNRIGFVNL
jgi:hypothetical protein